MFLNKVFSDPTKTFPLEVKVLPAATIQDCLTRDDFGHHKTKTVDHNINKYTLWGIEKKQRDRDRETVARA